MKLLRSKKLFSYLTSNFHQLPLKYSTSLLKWGAAPWFTILNIRWMGKNLFGLTLFVLTSTFLASLNFTISSSCKNKSY